MACQFKGQGFIGLLVGLDQLRGPEARTKLLPHLNPDLKALVAHGGVVSSGWYPLSWYSELTTAIRTEFGPELGIEIGRLGMKNDINSFIRFVLALGTPLMLLRLSSRVFRLYFEGAELSVKQTGPKEGRLQFAGLDGSCAATWDAIGGALLAFVELSGGKDVKLRIDEGGDFQSSCAFVVSWG